MTYYQKHLFVCTNQKAEGKTCCAQTGGEPFFNYLKTALQTKGLHGPNQCRVSKAGCLGRCALGPCLVIYPEGVWYTYTSFADLDEIIEKHIMQNEQVTRLCLPDSSTKAS